VIIKTPKQRQFVSISNDLAQDSSLTFEARGVLLYLLSHPPDWDIRASDVERNGNVSGEKRRRIMSEIEAAGYLTCQRVQDEKGLWSWESTLHESPLEAEKRTANLGRGARNRSVKNRTSVEPNFGLPELRKKALDNKTENTKTIVTKTERGEVFMLPAFDAQPEAETHTPSSHTEKAPEIGEEPFEVPVIPKAAKTEIPTHTATLLNSGRNRAKNGGPTLTDSEWGAYEVITTYFPGLSVSRCRKNLTDFLSNNAIHATDAALLCGWLYANGRRFQFMQVNLLEQIWAEFSASAEADIAAARKWCENPFNDEKLRSAMFIYSMWKNENPHVVESYHGAIETPTRRSAVTA
jgi:hypothetical protein